MRAFSLKFQEKLADKTQPIVDKQGNDSGIGVQVNQSIMAMLKKKREESKMLSNRDRSDAKD